MEKGRVPCVPLQLAGVGTLCPAPRDHGRQQACDSRCQPICDAHATAE
jgi:hypothetical protein